MTGPVVTVVLWHSPLQPLTDALDALRAGTLVPAKVLVHVNDDDGTELTVDATVSRSTENLGFAGGHNLLLGRAFAGGAPWAVVHNPDLVLAPTALALLGEAVARDPHRLLGPLLQLGDPRTGAPTGLLDTAGFAWTWDGRHLDVGQGTPLPALTGERPVDGISGACLVVTREVWDRLGPELFDADFVAYREDAELAWRARRLGVPSVLVADARGVHRRGLRGTERKDAWVDLLGVRNRFLIAAKHGRRRPGRGPGPWLRDVVVLGAVLTVERSSLDGLRQAWRLRRRMREKGARLPR